MHNSVSAVLVPVLLLPAVVAILGFRLKTLRRGKKCKVHSPFASRQSIVLACSLLML